MTLHPLTEATVDAFAADLKGKLLAAQLKRPDDPIGWRREDWLDECRKDLKRHVTKGDPLDVAAYAMFCWFHSWATS